MWLKLKYCFHISLPTLKKVLLYLKHSLIALATSFRNNKEKQTALTYI